MTETFDVAVIGLGGLGAASASALAARGLKVVGFEQFPLGHARGASHDHSRIIRRSYHTAHYVELTALAYESWEAIDADARADDPAVRPMITTTGGVDLFPPGAAIDIDTYTAAMTTVGVDFEVIDGAEIRRRWPALTVADDVRGVYQADTGIVPADHATATMHRLARRHGADLRPEVPVLDLAAGPTAVTVTTPSGTVSAGHVVIAADAWTNHLLAPLGHRVPLTVLREQLSYFDLSLGEDRCDLGRLPTWIWMDDPSFYGFPVFGRTGSIKAAEDCGGFPVDPDTRTFEPSPDAEDRLRRFLTGLLAVPLGAADSKTCLYTLTPDRDFVVDRLADHPNVVVLLGAAHAFKFAAWLGRCAADLVAEGATRDDIGPFRLDRPGLTADAVSRACWLV